jgi:hypothetical protein
MSAASPRNRLSPESPGEEKRQLMKWLFLGWVIAISLGVYAIWQYGSEPGTLSQKLTRWPVESELALSAQKPTLLMFLHPRCPCSRTSVDELAILLSRSRTDFETTVIFIHPAGESEDWSRTGLRDKVAALSGVTVFDDKEGREGHLFGAATSGETFLFAPGGNLLFHGGITVARGHAGNNEGRRFLSGWKEETPREEIRETPVFGCSLDGLCSDF